VDKKFKDHIIICGLGETAMQIIEELESHLEKAVGKDTMIGEVSFRDYLVIESSSEAIEKMSSKWPKIHYLVGDATDDDVLEQANIRDAYGIFPVLSSEKDNLYITMAARQLNPHIRIVARTADVFNIGKKLFKGGANSVVSPNFIGGLRIVSEIARPHVTDFLDEMLRNKNTELKMAEVVISRDSEICGLSLKEARLPEKCGLMIIAMRKHGDQFYTYNPSAAARIEDADTVVVLGYRDQIVELRKQARGILKT
jgi:voltage-gated potassium channel